jgi:hypothetical protein
MLGLFRPLEEYVGPSILPVDAISLLRCVLKCSVEYFCLPFVGRDVSTVNWIYVFYYLD